MVLAIFGLSLCQDEMYQRIPIVAPPRRPLPALTNNNLGFGSSFMGVARNFVTSPSGQLAVSMAKEFINRSGGGNQVLSLNLTSLLVIVLLKALIFSAGLLGAGNWEQYGRGRALEGSEFDSFST